MTGLKSLFIFGLLLLVGCNTCQLPESKDGKYILSTYQVSFDAPSSLLWYPSRDIPSRFVPKSHDWVCMIGAFSDLIFVNDRRNGVIAIEIRRVREDFGLKPPQRIEYLLQKARTRHYAEIKTTPFISNYKSEITAPYVCNTPLPLAHETFDIKNGSTKYRCETEAYAYTIDEDDTCLLWFYFWSAPATYEENRAALDNLLKSLERVYPPETDS